MRRFNDDILNHNKLNGKFDGVEIEHVYGTEQCDFPKFWTAPLTLLCSKRAKSVLQDLIGDCVEFIPTDATNENLYLIHTLHYENAIDHDASVIRKLPSGLEVEYLSYSFIEERIKSLSIFKVLLNTRPYTTEIFVTSKFKNVVEKNELTGIQFVEIWNSDK